MTVTTIIIYPDKRNGAPVLSKATAENFVGLLSKQFRNAAIQTIHMPNLARNRSGCKLEITTPGDNPLFNDRKEIDNLATNAGWKRKTCNFKKVGQEIVEQGIGENIYDKNQIYITVFDRN